MSRSGIAIMLLSFSASSAVSAQSPAFSSRSEAQLYWSQLESRPGSAFNRIAPLPDNEWNAEWLPDVQAAWNQWDGVLKPRASAQVNGGRAVYWYWLNEGWLRWRVADQVSLRGGRDALLWGPAAFWNPSDPFSAENNKFNSEIELPGKDCLIARWQFAPAWSLSEISEVGRGHQAQGPARRDALKLDWVGAEASAAALSHAVPGGSVGENGWIQWTASQALLVYAEGAWAAAPATARAVPSASAGWSVEQVAPEGRVASMLAGAAYTYLIGLTLTIELWRSGGGYSDRSASDASAAAAAFAAGPGGRDLTSLGQLLDGAPTPFRRDYLGLQLMNSVGGQFSWLLRVTSDLDDGSKQAAAFLKQTLSDRCQVWAEGVCNSGGPGTEYGRFVRGEALVGVTAYLW
jgi:hypothetical protein